MIGYRFEISTYKSDSLGPGAVLLLDEPDSHLHPELAQNVIQTIQERLVKQLGIQVIMTT
jgi:AAA15 family ATPase/GTPase